MAKFWPRALIGCALIGLGAGSSPGAEPPLVKLKGVPFTDVEIRDGFWGPRRETNRTASVPMSLARLKEYGNFDDLVLAANRAKEGYRGPIFIDSDLYKALEAASYSLATHPDPALDKALDEAIALIAAAQLPDGYLSTWYIVNDLDRRWTNLRDNHELYCAGHLFEAAVAHHRATGKTTFLDVARKLADHIDATFGPGKRMGYPGHPEIELALIKLGDATGEARYHDLARFFVANRGSRFFAVEHGQDPAKYDGAYFQDDVPIRDHKNIKGHAVRACYLMSGATDVAARTGDAALLKMLDHVWRNTTEKNMYVTGGIGSSAANEGFTENYDLPNRTAYQETCASIALAQWAHRLGLLYGDSRYADVYERSLYNGVLAGVSLDGKKFFYVNPLESDGGHHRSDWFGCACCPPNVTRTLASLGGYAYAIDADALWINLYIQGSVKAAFNGHDVKVDVETDYPWDGKVTIRPQVDAATTFAFRLRVPGWCRGAAVAVNGEPVSSPPIERGYFVVSRTWKDGDVVTLDLPMPVRRVAANPNVKNDEGLLAIQRGPVVYCLEGVDHEADLATLYLPRDAELAPEKAPDLLGGVVVLKGTAKSVPETNWDRTLYQAAPDAAPVPIRAVPYYAWDNRKPGPMKVWLPTEPRPTIAGPGERGARVSMSFVSSNCQPEAVRDGIEPKSSGEQPQANCHWWPRKGTEEWVQYDWPGPRTIQGVRVYWFDDEGRGECRVPASWRIEYRDGETWKPVAAESPYGVARDGWNAVAFAPVSTDALRMVVKLQDGWAAGVHEWKVDQAEDD
ncbi:beta-L-arabinofuranosidase domain-containing protein [Planctomyces sp. SH-PL62]|uniref:glycoside hydrolase family 127 protein n=1 Tax=Planctomyces sp. SH-PL62 TaxID=1636152 RepID=UPI00078D84EF|nr:beta-L-arabinofuranosidase domain-containing protein [Planctomyces sp. SH-PL62]AMV40735.1 Non-reducing end beta-L-arabinofuranosidase [Planctomyces sp. SH-PL62]